MCSTTPARTVAPPTRLLHWLGCAATLHRTSDELDGERVAEFHRFPRGLGRRTDQVRQVLEPAAITVDLNPDYLLKEAFCCVGQRIGPHHQSAQVVQRVREVERALYVLGWFLHQFQGDRLAEQPRDYATDLVDRLGERVDDDSIVDVFGEAFGRECTYE